MEFSTNIEDHEDDVMCILPWIHMHPWPNGKTMLCCDSPWENNIGDLRENTLEEVWNGDKMKEVRRQVMNDERPDVCEPCFRLEDQGVQSLRQRHTAGVIPEARVNLYPDALDALDDDYSMPFELPRMEHSKIIIASCFYEFILNNEQGHKSP